MNAILELSLPVPFLIYCLNVVLTSLIVCSLAVILSRRRAWSLPTRHALLCSALAASLLAPAVIPLFPSVWDIHLSRISSEPEPMAAMSSVEIVPEETTPQRSDTTGSPMAGDEPDYTATPARNPDPAPVAAPPPLLPHPEVKSLTTGEWACIFGSLCCAVWLIGLLVGTARTVVALIRLQGWLRTVTVADSPLLANAVRRAADCVGLDDPPAVYRSSLLPVPVTVGLIHPRIVVPVGLETSLSPEQIQAVIQHEMAHIARCDAWIGLLQRVVAIVYWWNPLCRMANRQLEDLREQICDDIAIANLPDPGRYAITLLELAEHSSPGTPFPATLSIGSPTVSQLEKRIRHIGSPSEARSLRLTGRAVVGVVATVVLMTATILCAQVPARVKAGGPAPEPQPTPSADRPGKTPSVKAKPSLHDLIRQMAVHERRYLPYDIKAMETFRFPDDLTPRERAKSSRADGRKHQKLMEYAQLKRRIWRSKETELIDGKLNQGPYERFSDGERIVQVSPNVNPLNKNRQYHINRRKNEIFNYLCATPLYGVFCLSTNARGELFSEVFKDAKGVQLAWDNGDAKLKFGFGKPEWSTRFVLWLSRDHDWHPIRLQRFWDAKDNLFYDEWEVTRFVRRGKVWRVAEGTHRYHDAKDVKLPKAKIKYSVDFKVLKEKYGKDVDKKQFEIKVPPGADIEGDEKPPVPPAPPAKSRTIKVRVTDVAGRPIPNATVRLLKSRTSDWDVVKTDETGVAQSAKAPESPVSIRIKADGYRPVGWGMGSSKLWVMMAPVSSGVVTDKGKPVDGAWITNEPLQIRADGFAYVPNRRYEGRYKDWSNSEGLFELKTRLILRRRDTLVPFIAVNDDRDKIAIRFVPAGELGKKQELELTRVCHVVGHCLLEGITREIASFYPSLSTSAGRSIGFVILRQKLTPAGLRLDYQVRLPPGEYVLSARRTSFHPGFRIPVKIPAGKDKLDLGTTAVAATGAVALRDKPAPKLNVRWRAGQETTWEKLRGRVVVIDFWGTWCRPCVKDMPLLMKIADQFRGKPVQWLSIHTPNLSTFDDLDRSIAVCQEKSWDKRALPFATVLDRPVEGRRYSGQTSQRYGVVEWPTLIIVDQQGKVVGPVPTQRLAETITQLLER